MGLQKITSPVCHRFVYGVRGQALTPTLGFSGAANRGLPLTSFDNTRYFYIARSHFVKCRAEFGKGGDFQVLAGAQYQDVPLTVIEVWNK